MEFKALVANSSNKDRKNITRSLKEMGFEVVEATDNTQAVECLQKCKYDIVFAECNTQAGQWDEFVKTARKNDAKQPIILTAPKSKKIDELKKEFPNASKYLTMPFTAEQLKKTVSEYTPSLAC